jgi:hypothetical protein
LTRHGGTRSSGRRVAVSIVPSARATRWALIAGVPRRARSPWKCASISAGADPGSGRTAEIPAGFDGCQRLASADCPPADKAAAVSTPRFARKRRRGCQASQSRWRAVKRATVGGWMTARWSGVFVNARRKRRVRKVPSSSAGGFTHGGRKGVSKSGASAGARNANVGCRSEIEASWRCVQVPPQGETSRNVERR